MNRILAPLARLAMGLWIGAVACLSFLVAPRVFEVFRDDRAGAGELMRPLFARIDLFGIGAAALFLIAARGRRWRAILAACLGAAAAINRFGVTPRIVARPPDVALWHRISVGLWGAILIGGALLVLLGPGAPRPRRGIDS